MSHIRTSPIPADSALRVINSLKNERDRLAADLRTYDESVEADFRKIRDAWSAKVEQQKLKNAELKQQIATLKQLLQAAEEKAQGNGIARGEKRSKVDYLAQAAETVAMETKLEAMQRESSQWKTLAVEYLGESVNVDPMSFQINLIRDKNRLLELERNEALTNATVRNLTKKVAEANTKIQQLEIEVYRAGVDRNELERALEVSQSSIVRLTARIETLTKCLNERNAHIVGVPHEEVTGLVPVELENEPLVKALRSQLEERKQEHAFLCQEIESRDKTIRDLQETAKRAGELEDKVNHLERIRNNLVTHLQRAHVQLSTKTDTSSHETSSLSSVGATECTVKRDSAAARRLQSLKLEHRCQQEMLLRLIQFIFGWKVDFYEDPETNRLVLIGTCVYTPQEDPGRIEVSVPREGLIPYLSTAELRNLASQELNFLPRPLPPVTSALEDCTAPILSSVNSSEPKLQLVFSGRFKSKWTKGDRWPAQMASRRLFPTFLAFVVLDEHHSRQRRQGWKQPSEDSPASSLIRDPSPNGE